MGNRLTTGLAEELLAPGIDVTRIDGYLDVGLERPELASTLGQRAMQSTLLPHIYEAVWRPVGFTFLSAGHDADAEDRRIAELLAVRPGDRILDVACGPGNTTRRLARGHPNAEAIVGVDAAASMLRRAVADTDDPRIDYVRADACALPFPDGVFDAATCLGALYLIDDPMVALGELVRVLRPGGRLALLSSCLRGPLPLRWAERLVTAPGGVRMFSRDELTHALSDLGMTDVECEVNGFMQIVGARRAS